MNHPQVDADQMEEQLIHLFVRPRHKSLCQEAGLHADSMELFLVDTYVSSCVHALEPLVPQSSHRGAKQMAPSECHHQRAYTRHSTRSRSTSKLALPKTIRFCNFKQLTCAST